MLRTYYSAALLAALTCLSACSDDESSPTDSPSDVLIQDIAFADSLLAACVSETGVARAADLQTLDCSSWGITDLSGIIQGGMGVAAGGNINPDPGGSSMFEPMGGSAPKYTGQGVINPIAAINAAGMLLDQIGQTSAAARVNKAIQSVTGNKMKSQDAGRMGYSTSEVGDLVCEAL